MSLIRQTLMVVAAACGHLAIGQEIDQLPIVNVRLKPPANSLPQVVAEIALLDGTRKDTESANLQALDMAFHQAVTNVSSSIPEVVTLALGRLPKRLATSLLEVQDNHEDAASAVQSFGIEVRPPHEPDVSIKAKLDQLERKRLADEEHVFEQANREFAVLSRMFTSEVLAQLGAHASGMETRKALGFLQTFKGMRRSGSKGSSPSLNVRLSTSTQAFPTIEGLALAMEGRRDASETIIRKRILELESQFFEISCEVLHDTLRKALLGIA